MAIETQAYKDARELMDLVNKVEASVGSLKLSIAELASLRSEITGGRQGALTAIMTTLFSNYSRSNLDDDISAFGVLKDYLDENY